MSCRECSKLRPQLGSRCSSEIEANRCLCDFLRPGSGLATWNLPDSTLDDGCLDDRNFNNILPVKKKTGGGIWKP